MQTAVQARIYSFRDVLKFLQAIVLGGLVLYFGKTLLVPLCFGLLIAIVGYPVSKRLENKGFSRTLAASVILLGVIVLFALLSWLLFYELQFFFTEIPKLRVRFLEILNKTELFLSTNFQMKDKDFNELLKGLNGNIGASVMSALSVTSSTIVMLILIPIYAVLFLVHRRTFVRFLRFFFDGESQKKLDEVLQKSIVSYYKFVKGTFFVYCIVAVLNSAGLLMIGIPHAILFGTVCAFMTIIPYLGIIVSAALPVSVALLTRDSLWYAIGVIAVFTFVQYLEANLIFPRVVGSQLNLSTWTVLVSVILGSLIWGISGMILFVPFAAILKLCSDQVEGLKSLNILMNRKEFM